MSGISQTTLRSSQAPILLVDTSIQGVSIGLALAGGIPSHGCLVYHRQHLNNMGSMIAISGLVAEGLQHQGLTPAQLRGVAVGIGPGSFTGIKVGLAFAYGLRTALDGALPVLGLSALELAAKRLRRDRNAKSFLIFLPATRTHGYLGIATDDGLVRSLLVETETGAALDEALRSLPIAAGPVCAEIVGEWPQMHAALALRGVNADAVTASEVCAQAIYGMADTTAHEWPAGFASLTELPGPRYLRLSTAEERLVQLAEKSAQLVTGGPLS